MRESEGRSTDLFAWFGPKREVLCVGGTHLDTIATTRPTRTILPSNDGTDIEPGEIVHAVGGSAYNVAANLARDDVGPRLKVRLFTILSRYSAFSQILYRRMREVGIDRKYVHLLQELTERAIPKPVLGGGFVGIVDGSRRQVKHAVTQLPLQHVDLFVTKQCARSLKQALRRAKAVHATCGMHPETLAKLVRRCDKTRVPVFLTVGLTHEGLQSWLQASSNLRSRVCCLCGRLDVLIRMLAARGFPKEATDTLRSAVKGGTAAAGFDADKICAALKTRHLVCVDFEDVSAPEPTGRYAILGQGSSGGTFFSFGASEAIVRFLRDGNTTGITDAALAGFMRAHYLLANEAGARLTSYQLDLADGETQEVVRTHIEHVVLPAARSDGPTPNSLILTEEDPEQQNTIAQIRRGIDQINAALKPISSLVNAIILTLVSGLVISIIVYWGKLCEIQWLTPLIERWCQR